MVIIKDNQYYIPITSNGYGTFRRKNIGAVRFYSNATKKPLANKRVYGSGADGYTDATGLFIIGELEEGSRDRLWYAVGHWGLPYHYYEQPLDKVYSCVDIYVEDYFTFNVTVSHKSQVIVVTISDGTEYTFDGVNGSFRIMPEETWTATLSHKVSWDHYGTLNVSSGTAEGNITISASMPYDDEEYESGGGN